ncbi:hypothetical protein [Plesiomonas shigelloides]|uniref:hypothetical protein n=1 Tax=Plesiomonas shigelloides TaxID=703 RepID=UPI00242EAC14|nr:hypothetical protein [Plesiomonas shigelloides]
MIAVLRRQLLIDVIRSRRKAWTASELYTSTGLREPVLAEALARLCADGSVKVGQTAQQRTYYFAE